MIQHIAIKHFQSLHDINLELGPFTVIIGPSDSGKSAFIRALRTLSSNRRGTDFIEHGQKTASITARTEHGTVALTRGLASSDNAYKLVSTNENPPKVQTFTKLGGETPEEISTFLGIESKNPINYASQFDKPYLLDTSAPEVARTLGALTNVSVIFAAAREANKQRLSASGVLRTRAGDLKALQGRREAFKGVSEAVERLETAEGLISETRVGAARLKRLEDLGSELEILEQQLAANKKILVLTCPSPAAVEAARSKLSSFESLLSALRRSDTLMKEMADQVSDISNQIKSAESEYMQLLRDLGSCPTCGQDTKEVHHHED